MFIEELHGVADVRAEERLGGVDRCGDHVAERRDTEVHHLEAGVHVFLLVVLGYLLAARKRLMISAMAASSLRISAIASSMMCYLLIGARVYLGWARNVSCPYQVTLITLVSRSHNDF